jgi:spermidine synthase
MIPWILLDTAIIPGDGTEMRLYQRDSEYSIRVGTTELMNNRGHASEDALASMVCERLGKRRGMRLLIGGMGMGFTLVRALRDVGDDGEVVIAELVPEVIAWHRGPLAEVSSHALDDPRVTVREVDVADVIREARNAYDAILLDVDNGPEGLTAEANDRLYTMAGLRASLAALRPGGILAIWSAGPNPPFTRRLEQAGFDTEEVRVRGRGAKGFRYLIWIARKRPSS